MPARTSPDVARPPDRRDVAGRDPAQRPPGAIGGGLEGGGGRAGQDPLVSIVIPCYNHGRFLAEAIESALGQTYPRVEVVVVDDGSTDDTAAVAARYPAVRYVRQANAGLAAARNAGLAASAGDLLVFLDADDRLLPRAVERGLECFRERPDCAFVYGTYSWVRADGTFYDEGWAATRVFEDHYAEMLRRNFVTMHAAVMYRREPLEAVGGFDTALAACEDYDLYLRLTRAYPAYCHSQPVAEYRMHDANMSGAKPLMLRTSLQALRRQRRHVRHDARLRRAYAEGVRFWKDCYGRDLAERLDQLWRRGARRQALREEAVLLRHAPRWFLRHVKGNAMKGYKRLVRAVVPGPVWRALARVYWGQRKHPPVGAVRMGDLRRTAPLSRQFGFDRGRPVDRYYIEGFLDRHAHDVRGCVCEIKDAAYTRRFGGDRVTRSEVLDVDEGNPEATLIADLNHADHLPSERFDCILFNQTLHLIYDFRAALATLHRTLKPGGVLLATFPGITSVAPELTWYWAFTPASAQRLFEEVFPPDHVAVSAYGNVLAAQAFLQGMADEELTPAELDRFDPSYPVTVAVRAVKPPAAA